MNPSSSHMKARIVVAPLERLRRLRIGRRTVAPDLPERDLAQVVHQLDALLLEPDVGPARAEVAALAGVYASLDPVGRERFWGTVVQHFGADPRAVDQAVAAWSAATDDVARRDAAGALRSAAIPGYVRLLRLFTGLDDGVKLLVDLRADLRTLPSVTTELRELDEELSRHLEGLFTVSLLELRRITWESPAALLEKLISYEAVHAIVSWADLKNRLASDRRCYALFHPAMPNEPLVFVEIALTKGMAAQLAPLLDEDAPLLDVDQADTANFYSITSCQPGLKGVNLGNELLGGVVEQLSEHLPGVRTYVTLSPIPGFRRWLTQQLAADGLTSRERAVLPPVDELREMVEADSWLEDDARAAALRKGVTALCARYLTSTRPDGRVLDPVANFHLTNGAEIRRLNWLANPGPEGRRESLGLMVNYGYVPERIAANAAAYGRHRRVATSDAVRHNLLT